MIVDEIASAPQPGQELPMASSEMSPPANADLLAKSSSPRSSSVKQPEVAESPQEEPAAKRMKPGESVLRGIEMVERRLVKVKIANETYHHLDNIIDADFVNAWGS